ncbi:MAG: efflux RND transporter periplasmic adaptor subunit [Nevskia sp.]|nr:efflux RND transporter periplasmic adaptor subunit [Nevskia sp.]
MFGIKSRRSGAIAGGAALAAIAALAFVVHASLFGPPPPPPPAAVAQPLPVVAAAPRDISQQIELPGEFRPYQEAELDAKVRGYVQKMNVDVGDAVRQGQVLAVLEVPELKDQLASSDAAVAVAQQQVQKARAQSQDDRGIYERLLGVSRERPELVAQQDLDAARARADASAAALTAAEASVKQAIANRTGFRDTDAYTRILAPFDGVISRRYVDQGALVGAPGVGNAMFHIAELKRLRLVVMVPESAVPDVAVGRPARALVPALDQGFDVAVSRISHQLADDTRTMHTEFDFDNAGDLVSPGMYAQVQLPLKQRPQALAVPLGAIHERDQDQAKVYVLDSGGAARPRQVRLGLSGTDYAEIVSGLQPGELVAVDVTPETGTGVRYEPKRMDRG